MVREQVTIQELMRAIDEMPRLPRDVLSLAQYTRPMLERCMDLATLLERAPRAVCAELARGKILAVMFYQQSTRTRMSFEAAMLGLGGHVVGFADPTTTRAVGFYEETLEDVVRFTAVMSDIMVLRHPETGSANRAASVSPVPIINAGDGYGEHPTQAMGDVHHLRKHFGRVDGLKVGIVGHLGWRAHRSLAIALSLFDVQLFVLEPPGASIPEDVDRLLQQRGIPVHPCSNVAEVLRQVDVVTTLGVHHANFHADFDDKANLGARQEAATPDDHRISASAIAGLDRFVPVLHIGPIADHIDRALDAMPQAHYFKQARDCVWMRSALLASMLGDAS